MDALDAIRTRRSIRLFHPTPVPPELLHSLLEVACLAPSAGNQQPWQFLVLDDSALLRKVPLFHPSAKMLLTAPLVVLVCGDLSREKYKGYWMIDCAAATENLLLAAHAMGLGGCWLGIYPREDRMEGIRKLIVLPPSIVPFALVALGYPAEKKPPEHRFSDDRVHHNTW